MQNNESNLTCGEAIPKLLEAYGVDTIFGIPGVHTIEMYRGIVSSPLRHITPRHEQGAGFMADGYARASGSVGVCFIITGPGMTNIITAMAQAMQDSIPMLVISSVNRTGQLSLGEGRLHELPNQNSTTEGVTAFTHTLLNVNNLPKVMARAFSVFNSKRPAPVHIEIPIDVLTHDAAHLDLTPWPMPSPPGPSPSHVQQAANMLTGAKRPLIIIGGGTKYASSELTQIAEYLDAPVINTNNAKGVIPASHPLAVGGTPSQAIIREEIEKHADVILAIGTELSETDFDFFFLGDMQMQGELIRVDIDAEQLTRNQKPTLAIVSDSVLACQALIQQLFLLTPSLKTMSGASRCLTMQQDAEKLKKPSYAAVFEVIDSVLPDCIIVGDSTQPVYYGMAYYETNHPNRFFHSATGYGTLGYAFPAAVGAKLAQPEKPIIGLTGDGGGQFSHTEISSAVEAQTPVIYLVWNNKGHGEIRRFMEDSKVEKIGVDLHTPDYVKLAQAMGCEAARATSLESLTELLKQCKNRTRPFLIELIEQDVVDGYAF